jgi:hypothetical protein
MTAPLAVKDIGEHRADLEATLAQVVKRAGNGLPAAEAERVTGLLLQRSKNLIDSWQNVIAASAKEGGKRAYSRFDPEGKGYKSLLRVVLDPVGSATPDELKFEAPLSMRDVELSVHLWIQRQPLGGYKTPKLAPATEPEDGSTEEVTNAAS